MSINRDFMFAWMGEWAPLSGDATLDNPAEARAQDDIKYIEARYFGITVMYKHTECHRQTLVCQCQ